MTAVTLDQLRQMCKVAPNESNMKSLRTSLDLYGSKFNLDAPQILPQFLCQWMHESGSFKYDKEIWGPTPAQKRYEGRKDLGNTQKGDGKKFMGRTAAQLTGRANYAAFTKWCRENVKDREVPDFTKNPELINQDPWEGLVPIWYWVYGNPERKSLNKYAQDNNIEMITQRINGGKNGLGDRMDYYVRCALVLLGYSIGKTPAALKTALTKFQKERKLEVDGIAGAMTRQELHIALGGKNPFKEVVKVNKPVAVDKPVAVVAEDVKKPWYTSKDALLQTVTGPVGVTAVGWFNDVPWEKLLFLTGIVTVGTISYFLYRHWNREDVKQQVQDIKADSALVTEDIIERRQEAEVKFKNLQAG